MTFRCEAFRDRGQRGFSAVVPCFLVLLRLRARNHDKSDVDHTHGHCRRDGYGQSSGGNSVFRNAGRPIAPLARAGEECAFVGFVAGRDRHRVDHGDRRRHGLLRRGFPHCAAKRVQVRLRPGGRPRTCARPSPVRSSGAVTTYASSTSGCAVRAFSIVQDRVDDDHVSRAPGQVDVESRTSTCPRSPRSYAATRRGVAAVVNRPPAVTAVRSGRLPALVTLPGLSTGDRALPVFPQVLEQLRFTAVLVAAPR